MLVNNFKVIPNKFECQSKSQNVSEISNRQTNLASSNLDGYTSLNLSKLRFAFPSVAKFCSKWTFQTSEFSYCLRSRKTVWIESCTFRLSRTLSCPPTSTPPGGNRLFGEGWSKRMRHLCKYNLAFIYVVYVLSNDI